MIYFSGDIHGRPDNICTFCERYKLTCDDVLVLLGDVGANYCGDRRDEYVKEMLDRVKPTVLCVHGNHEARPSTIAGYELVDWNGGKVHKISHNIVHLMRGQTYTIEGKKIFTFGGGHSQDFEFRHDGDWWEREQPTHAEIIDGIRSLKEHDFEVDYIVTHEPPASLKDCLGVDVFQRIEVHAFFEDVIKTVKYEKWFFGKCHIDKHIPMKFYAVFNTVTALK